MICVTAEDETYCWSKYPSIPEIFVFRKKKNTHKSYSFPKHGTRAFQNCKFIDPKRSPKFSPECKFIMVKIERMEFWLEESVENLVVMILEILFCMINLTTILSFTVCLSLGKVSFVIDWSLPLAYHNLRTWHTMFPFQCLITERSAFQLT